MSETATYAALAQCGYPVHLLGAHSDTSLPRISYSYPDCDYFFADDKGYTELPNCEVRLYTDCYPSADAEAAVEDALRALGCTTWSKSRVPIPSERMHETTYRFTDRGKE